MNQINYNEINNPTKLASNSQVNQTNPLSNASPSNEILYFSINQDSE